MPSRESPPSPLSLPSPPDDGSRPHPVAAPTPPRLPLSVVSAFRACRRPPSSGDKRGTPPAVTALISGEGTQQLLCSGNCRHGPSVVAARTRLSLPHLSGGELLIDPSASAESSSRLLPRPFGSLSAPRGGGCRRGNLFGCALS